MRAVSFAIADGQLPSNVKAGYVIRRILRRSVRYAYSFLNMKEPFMYKLVPTLVDLLGGSFPELISQQKLIEKVIMEEENVFLKTLEKGIRLLDQTIDNVKKSKSNCISGKDAFVLYDTFGFPLDLTELIAKENGLLVDKTEFDVEMLKQKNRGRTDANVDHDDWTILHEENSAGFIGYDNLKSEILITKYRKVTQKTGDIFQLVFNETPFYAESGGQVGDTGFIENDTEKIIIENTIKEHNQIIHISKELPKNIENKFFANVDAEKRMSIARNHSATHLLHFALRKVLGEHVEQKGSLVDNNKLRFDFAHFSKLTKEELRSAEVIVNSLIRNNNERYENRQMKIADAQKMGAMALFGEKYGDVVRVIKFGDSIELCGGSHVKNTGQIGFFKIISEGAIAAGIRRIEAITGEAAENFVFDQIDTLSLVSAAMNNSKDIIQNLETLISENSTLKKHLENYKLAELKIVKKDLVENCKIQNDISIISAVLNLSDSNDLKEICSQIRGELKSYACVLGTVIDNKPYLAISFSDDLINTKKLNAGQLIRDSAKLIDGGGGGQAYMATAGGKNAQGIEKAVDFAIGEILGKV